MENENKMCYNSGKGSTENTGITSIEDILAMSPEEKKELFNLLMRCHWPPCCDSRLPIATEPEECNK